MTLKIHDAVVHSYFKCCYHSGFTLFAPSQVQPSPLRRKVTKFNNSKLAEVAHTDFAILQGDKQTLRCWCMITSMLGVLRDATKDLSNGIILHQSFWALFFVVDVTFLHNITLKKFNCFSTQFYSESEFYLYINIYANIFIVFSVSCTELRFLWLLQNAQTCFPSIFSTHHSPLSISCQFH